MTKAKKKKYSEYLVDLDLVLNFKLKLSDMSKKYGKSKAWSGQIFKDFYGESFSNYKRDFIRRKEKEKEVKAEVVNVKFMLNIPEKLHKQFKKRASQDGITMSMMILRCMKNYIIEDKWSQLEKDLL